MILFHCDIIQIEPFRYARLYLAIQFFDSRSLLPPPFTYLTIIMYFIKWASRTSKDMLVDMKISGTEMET